MSIILRTLKGSALTYEEMDRNLSQYFYSSSIHDSGTELRLHFTGNSTLDTTSGQIASNVSGSSFQPYITTVGLYNEANELVAVAKMGQPLPKSADTDMSIVVKLDMNFGVNRFKQLQDYT